MIFFKVTWVSYCLYLEALHLSFTIPTQ